MNVGEGMKYSFGGDNKGTGVILPHIAFPVRSALQIKTVEGADVGSSNENNNNNNNNNNDMLWNTNETYSFMYYAQSIDLANWKVLLPFEMDVSRFWGDSPLRLVIYEQEAVDEEHTTMKPKEKKNYAFELQLEHMKLPSSSSSSSYYNDHSNAKVTNNTTRRRRDEFLPV
jgi:uncharacterized protein YueI